MLIRCFIRQSEITTETLSNSGKKRNIENTIYAINKKSVTGLIYCCQTSLPSASYYSWGVCLQESINKRNIQFFMFKCPCSLMKHCLFAYRKCKLYSFLNLHIYMWTMKMDLVQSIFSKFSLQDHCTKEIPVFCC